MAKRLSSDSTTSNPADPIESLFIKCPDALSRASKATQSILSLWAQREFYTQWQPHRAGETMFVASLLRGALTLVFTLKQDELLRALKYEDTITDIDLPFLPHPIHQETAHSAAGMFVYDVTTNAEQQLFKRLAGATVNKTPIETFRGLVSWCNVSEDWEKFARDIWVQMSEADRSFFANEETKLPLSECCDVEIRVRHEWGRYREATDVIATRWETNTKKNWCKLFDWSAQTMRNRRAEFSDCFQGGARGRSCSIRGDMVALWIAAAGKKSS